jgi:NAD(P)-dependent dehydrogenase (short-subunit alcohol dehydrogenase family)
VARQSRALPPEAVSQCIERASFWRCRALAAITKGGLDAVTRSLAIEYAGRGIRVNAVSPGIIKTPMHPVETHDFFATLHPMGRMGAVAEVVEAVLYLETAGFIAGETLHVDGGAHAGHW